VKYFIEHRSVGVALVSLGVDDSPETAWDAGDAKGAVVVVGWSSRETLLLSPEYACLSRPEVTYLRLPLARADARILRYSHAQTLNEAAPCSELPPPGEQWVWALEQLQTDLREGARNRSQARLAELRRYATAKWPGWYEGALRAIKRSVEEGEGAENLIEICRRQSPVIESLDAVARLLRWSEAEGSLQALELVKEVASYARQGALDLQSCRQAISEEPAWRDLLRKCEADRAALMRLGETGRPADVRVQEGAVEVYKGVTGLLDSLISADADLEEYAERWSADVDRIWAALQTLSNLRDSVHASLHF
jgi:hypothetical protein